MSEFFEMSDVFQKRKYEVEIVEHTTFSDGRKEEMTKKRYSDVHSLYKALKNSGIKGEIIYQLKKYSRAVIEYDDAKTVIEIKGQPKIMLTDGDE